MAVRKGATRSSDPRKSRGDSIKDEVYRQMFRLEAGRQGADLALAVALLRGWVASNPVVETASFDGWLKKISPVSLLLIEAYRQGKLGRNAFSR